MEDVLDLYEEPYDPKRPVVCFDEMPYQMVAQTRTPPYTRQARASDALRLRLRTQGDGQRLRLLRAEGMLAASGCHRAAHGGGLRRSHASFGRRAHYPEAEKVRVVLDNLNTHTPASLYKAFEPEEARRLLRGLEFHHTPKHASWLNQVEIELSALSRQCLRRRIPDESTLKKESAAWETERNKHEATVSWRFTASDAREKLKRLYPPPS